MLFEKAGFRSEKRLAMLNGPDFYGQFLAIPDTTRVSNFNSARRLLRVREEVARFAKLNPGKIVIDEMGIEWLAGEHGWSIDKCHYFKLFQVDQVLPWTRPVDVIDAVTGLKKSSEVMDLGLVRGTYEPRQSVETVRGIEEPRNLLITNASLKLGDYVDARRVVKVDQQIGLTIAEVIG